MARTPAAADVGNDRYQFAPSASRQRSVTLAPGANGATLSLTRAILGKADTILLGVRVAGSGDTPRIRARIGNVAIEQHLDPNAHGLRWLNLTSLRSAIGERTTLALEAQNLTITSQQASLRLFENHLPFERGMLVIAAHPDDAEIAAFGLYASHADQTRIVTITAGNAGPATYRAQFEAELASQYLFKGVLRVIDSVTVPWQGGVPPERCYNLGYFDARLSAMHAHKSEPVSEMYRENCDILPYRRANLAHFLPSESRLNSWQNLVEDLETLLSQFVPSVIVMPHPLLDTHSDHQFVTVAVLEALAKYTQPIAFLLYSNHAGKNLYPYGPAGSVMSLPAWTASDLPVQGLYALPTDRALQRRKLFALESMHDLRLSPDEQAHCNMQLMADDSERNPSTDYFRRAPRSEELFFVYDRAGVSALGQRFLATQGAPK